MTATAPPSSAAPNADIGSRAAAAGLVAILALVAVLRLLPLLAHDWPLWDGGLFYVMIGDILDAGFGLPEFVTYQGGTIPFAYPPLGFYVAASAEALTGADRTDILRFLPSALNVACVLAMYLLATELGPSRRHALVAAAFYGALLGVIGALVAGGGLTRAPGLLLALLATWQGMRMYRTGRWRHVAATAVLAGLAVATHPEAGPFIAIALGAAWLTRWRTRQALVQTLVAAAGALIIIAPWVATVVARHGFDPFLSASAVPDRDLFESVIAYAFLFLLTVPAVGILDIVGQVHEARARRPFLLVWRIGVFALDARFSPLAGAAPVSLLAAHGTLDVLVPAVWRLAAKASGATAVSRQGAVRRMVVVVVVALAFIPAMNAAIDATGPDAALTPSQRAAMTWVREHTPTETRTVSLATAVWGSDIVSEWFPALSGRTSMTTTQGYEWAGDRRDPQRMAERELLKCRTDPVDRAACVDAWVRRYPGPDSVVVYVDDSADAVTPDGLVADLLVEHGYQLLWQGEDGVVVTPPSA